MGFILKCLSIMLKVGEESCSYCFLVIFPLSKAFNAFCFVSSRASVFI
jgi:hypothetical protein